MENIKHITDNIAYLKASSDPLSADVAFIKGNKYTWIFDVGANDESRDLIESIKGPKAVVISHFHQDHMGNLDRIKYDLLYTGDFTYKKIKTGTVVKDEVYIDDGVKIHITSMPSSHCKGCLAMEIDEKYVFLGDSVYCFCKDGRPAYNKNILSEQIKSLNQLKAPYALLSHASIFIKKKSTVIKGLEYIHDRKTKDPYIWVDY